jgi:hypothetical protein
MGQKNKFEHYYLQCEQLYIHGKTLAEITACTGVSDKTLGKWKAEYEWEDKRKHFFSTSAGSVITLEEMLGNFIADVREKGWEFLDADKLAKITSSIEKIRKIGDIYSMTVSVMDRFVDFMNTEYPVGDNETAEKRETLENAIKGFFRFIEKGK